MKKRYWFWVTTLLFLAAMLCSSGLLVAQAQDIVPEPPVILTPVFFPPAFEGLRIEYQRVNVTIREQVATTHIEQLFVNEGNRPLEGSYFFPLPEGATVSQLTMWVDGTPIEAKILGREEARAIYDAIVRQLRDPALLEYMGSSAIQANVFPIPAHDERRIEIEYSQVLPVDNGLVQYIYPQSTDLYTNTPLDNQSIRVEVQSAEAIRTIYSPSHAVAIERDGDFRAVVGYEASGVTADTNFELYYSVSPEEIGLNLLSYRESGQDGFFVLLAAPSVEVDEVVAKDVILVLDTSGSMEGEKMAQAKEAAAYVVGQLNPEDRFNVVSFSTGMRSFAPELVPASEAGNYETFINSLEALGGTNISLALLEAMNQADGERPTTIIFLTDGLATEGITDTGLLVETVQQATPANVRLFAFGVGNDVDTTLLDSLAQNHRGTSTYVRPFQAIDETVSAFYAKVSTPVLADISLDFGGMVVEQLYPQTLPDLFAGSQLVLAGRYREGGPATITLRGTVNGQEKSFVYRDQFFRLDSGDEFIPRLWATRAIGHLLTEIRLHGENPELVQSVVNLSIRYGIITPYTSYLIEEDDIFTQTGRQIIVEEEVADMAAEPPSFTGAEAVEEAAVAGEMADAAAPLALPTVVPGVIVEGEAAAVSQPVQFVGSKTFVWRDGVWLDTAFDPHVYTVTPVNFASDGYFELVTAVPELAQYFSLGQQVLVVHEDIAYEIVERGGTESLPVTVDESSQPPPANEVTATATAAALSQNPTPGNLIASSTRVPETPVGGTPLSTGWGLFVGVLLALVALGVGVRIGRKSG